MWGYAWYRHTGVVVYGKEFFFGGGVGIEFCNPVRRGREGDEGEQRDVVMCV